MADYKAHASGFEKAGVNVVWISSDAPSESASLRDQLDLPFAFLADAEREVISGWGLLNPAEHGGVAIPTTFLVDDHRIIRSRWLDTTGGRTRAEAVLEGITGELYPQPA